MSYKFMQQVDVIQNAQSEREIEEDLVDYYCVLIFFTAEHLTNI